MNAHVMKVTILCNEYISHVLICTIRNSVLEKTGEWDMKDNVKHKDMFTYGSGVSLHYNPSTNTLQIPSIKESNVSLDEWNAYARGEDNPRLNSIKRIKMLEKITEGQTIFYYRVLNIFDYLYSKGYWTYGGFKNYIIDHELKIIGKGYKL